MLANIIVTIFAIAILCCGGASAADIEDLLIGIADEQAQLEQQLNRHLEQQLQPKLKLAMEIDPRKGNIMPAPKRHYQQNHRSTARSPRRISRDQLVVEKLSVVAQAEIEAICEETNRNHQPAIMTRQGLIDGGFLKPSKVKLF